MPLGTTPLDGMTLPPNSTSDASNVHEARNALGKRLRELRQAAGLSGRQLAESLSWPPSKVSKLENGRQTPADGDIRGWTRATGGEGETEALLASLHTLEVQHAEWQRILRTGLRPRQQELIEWDQKTRFLRVFEATVIPGLLQTAEYARSRFAEGIRRLGLPNDINDAIAARLQRQEILYRPDKRFHFVLTEAALKFRLCPPEVMLGQLDRLMSLSSLPNVRLGIVDFETQYTTSPWHGFWLYDDKRVLVETFSAALDLRQPQEIKLYGNAFEKLAAAASYGRSARAIIARGIDALLSDTQADGEKFP
jgi:transcriptional regulator with XRE-family HTH domain